MGDIGQVMNELQKLHSDFTMKVGQKSGNIVVEMRLGEHKPATSMGTNLVVVVAQALAGTLQNMAEKILAESRLSEAVFDNEVAKMEGDCSHHCCGCSKKEEEDDDDDYYEYDDDDGSY